MTTTKTYTTTKSLTALTLIKIQVMAALRNGADVTEDSLTSIRYGLDKRWIRQIIIYGFDMRSQCRAGLFMSIDWKLHQIRIDTGNDMVEVGPSWRDDIAPEVDEMVIEFVDFCRRTNLRREWRVVYGSNAPANANAVLGLVKAKPITWAGRAQTLPYTLKGLDEFAIEIRLVE